MKLHCSYLRQVYAAWRYAADRAKTARPLLRPRGSSPHGKPTSPSSKMISFKKQQQKKKTDIVLYIGYVHIFKIRVTKRKILEHLFKIEIYILRDIVRNEAMKRNNYSNVHIKVVLYKVECCAMTLQLS